MKTIFRTNKNKGNFVQVDNALINILKPKELGLMLYFLSMPDYYKFRIEEIEGITSDGMKAIKSGIKELEKKGYIIKVKERDMLGQFKNDRYIIKECPKIEVNIENKDINIYRITKSNNFTLVDKGFIYDNRLSLDAKGILCYMLSKPNYWKFYASEIQKTLNVGRKIVEKSIKELQNFRYIRAKKINKRNIEYKIFEKPINAKMIYCKIFTAHNPKSTLPLPKKYITITQKVHYHKPKSTTNKNLIKNPIKNLYQSKSKFVNFDLQDLKEYDLSNKNNNSSIDIVSCIEDNDNKQYAVGNSGNDINSAEYIKNTSSHCTESSLKENKDDGFLKSLNQNQTDNLNNNKEVLIACEKFNDTNKEKSTSIDDEVTIDYEYDNTGDEICQIEDDDDYISNEDIDALKEKYRIYISDICEFTNEQLIGLAKEFNYHQVEEFLEYVRSFQYSDMFTFITCNV